MRVGRTFDITPAESVRVLREEPGLLEVEGSWAPNGDAPPKHFHPRQDERFEVLEGVLTARVATWQTSPAGRTGEWFEAIDALRASGRVGKDGMPGPLAFGVYLTEYADVFRLAGPQPVLRPALRLLGAVGRIKGYRPPGG